MSSDNNFANSEDIPHEKLDQEKETGEEVSYKDFIPIVDPANSTCCSKAYTTFSSIVQEANEWLRQQAKIEVVNCEVITANHRGTTELLIHDSWPYTQFLRGLRIWWRKLTSEMADSEAFSKRRFLIGFRDFLPNVDRKSMFSGQFENVQEILMRINDYTASKLSPTKILALQTLDSAYEGYVDINADTDNTLVTISQHGFSRFVRFLRVFFLTQYPKLSRPHSALPKAPRLGIKDFASKPEDFQGLPSIVSRALQWICQTEDVALLNIQVLNSRTGSLDTSESVFAIESPGHIPNKFTTFVRVVFMSSNLMTMTGSTPAILDNFIPSTKNPLDIANKIDTKRPAVISQIETIEDIRRPESDVVVVDMDQNNKRMSSANSQMSKVIVVKPSSGSIHGRNDENNGDLRVKIMNEENASHDQTEDKNEEGDRVNHESKYIVDEATLRKETGGGIEEGNNENDGKKLLFAKNENDIDALSIIPDFEEIKNRSLISKMFCPQIITEGGCFSEPEYESMAAVLKRIRSWILSSGGIPVQIHTHYQYFRGAYPDVDKTQWAKYFPGGSWMPFLHLIYDPKKL